MNSATSSDRPNTQKPSANPNTSGNTNPTMAPTKDFNPVHTKRLTSVSKPTSNSSKIIPISAVSLMASTGSIQPSRLGPSTTPANSSPITEGACKRVASSAKTRAVRRMTSRYRKNHGLALNSHQGISPQACNCLASTHAPTTARI